MARANLNLPRNFFTHPIELETRAPATVIPLLKLTLPWPMAENFLRYITDFLLDDAEKAPKPIRDEDRRLRKCRGVPLDAFRELEAEERRGRDRNSGSACQLHRCKRQEVMSCFMPRGGRLRYSVLARST
jgi:hypothetical protein